MQEFIIHWPMKRINLHAFSVPNMDRNKESDCISCVYVWYYGIETLALDGKNERTPNGMMWNAWERESVKRQIHSRQFLLLHIIRVGELSQNLVDANDCPPNSIFMQQQGLCLQLLLFLLLSLIHTVILLISMITSCFSAANNIFALLHWKHFLWYGILMRVIHMPHVSVCVCVLWWICWYHTSPGRSSPPKTTNALPLWQMSWMNRVTGALWPCHVCVFFPLCRTLCIQGKLNCLSLVW